MNPRLSQLQPYPFAKLRKLYSSIEPNPTLLPIKLSIGEPEHSPPEFIANIIHANSDSLKKYPPTAGTDELKQTISNWATSRFDLSSCKLDPGSMLLPCNGTREALFAIVQTIIDDTGDSKPLVLMPNPFYQIYEGAALLAGAEPSYVNNDATTQQPDFNSVSNADWDRCQLLFICTPGNPSGVSLPLEQMKQLIHLADKHDFVIVSDECYSELYLDEKQPVPGLLQACDEIGRKNFDRCLVFHSLSKRSNLAGLRSGFVAGDPELISKFLLYRTYHGSAMSFQNQAASAAAWNDEQHVIKNRAMYREKYEAICPMIDGIIDYKMPDAGFYLWLKTPCPDVEFASRLYEQEHLSVLPGSFLSRNTEHGNPGEGYIRLALVSPVGNCVEGVKRILRQVDRS